MTTVKIAITISAAVLKLAREQVRTGHAKSLSALVSDAMDEKVRRNQLSDVLEAMDAEFGKPGRAAQRWAKRVLAR